LKKELPMKTGSVNTQLFSQALSESADGSGLLLRSIARMSEAYTEVLGICDEKDKALKEALVLLLQTKQVIELAHWRIEPPHSLIHRISQFIHKYSTTEVGNTPTNS
jgi:hypothetical protein